MLTNEGAKSDATAMASRAPIAAFKAAYRACKVLSREVLAKAEAAAAMKRLHRIRLLRDLLMARDYGLPLYVS